jgi:phage terminase large subunit
MGESVTEIVIPYAPRPLQRTIHQALEQHRFSVAVCHRRFGKTVLAINQLQKAALLCGKPRPRFAYIAPTYTQGKSIAWDYMQYYARPIPGVGVNQSELRVDYPNGGQCRIYGADNPDSLRGIYLDGVVLDEYGLMAPGVFSEVIRPLISDRLGWVLFIGTPNGKNQFYDIVQQAQRDPGWFFAEYRASQTGLIPPAELENARSQMTADEYAQEFECSFEASVKGAVFAREIIQAREAGRITRVPYDPALPMDTDWDLGVGDATAIWFSQTLYSGEVRLIDYYEATGHGLDHYRSILNKKGYVYGDHWAPHDIQVRELTSGHSRLQAASALGIQFQVSPKVESLEDGIHSARMLLPRCWFDREKCQRGLECLQSYRWDTNTRIHEFTHRPVHDWASHGADAFRGLAFRHYTPKYNPEKQAAVATRRAQRDTRDVRRPRSVGRGGY